MIAISASGVAATCTCLQHLFIWSALHVGLWSRPESACQCLFAVLLVVLLVVLAMLAL